MEAKMTTKDKVGNTAGMEVSGVNPKKSEKVTAPMNAERAVEAMKRRIGDLQERAESIKDENTKESILELQIINSEIAEIEKTVKNIQSGKITVREKKRHLFVPNKEQDRFSKHSANMCVVCGAFEGEAWDELKYLCEY